MGCYGDGERNGQRTEDDRQQSGAEGPREELHLLRDFAQGQPCFTDGCPSINVRLESLPSTETLPSTIKDKVQSVFREPEQEVGLGES